MTISPKPGEIWLVKFPFSDLTSAKLRPTLVLAIHREEAIILGIFSKLPTGNLKESWVLVKESDRQFAQTGLKKTSVIRADKIATVSKLVFHRKLGYLPARFSSMVQKSLKKALNMM